MRIGIAVYCTDCGQMKKPIGRDSAMGGYCDQDCEGYYLEPKPGSLWPGETELDFGYAIGPEATKDFVDSPK